MAPPSPPVARSERAASARACGGRERRVAAAVAACSIPHKAAGSRFYIRGGGRSGGRAVSPAARRPTQPSPPVARSERAASASACGGRERGLGTAVAACSIPHKAAGSRFYIRGCGRSGGRCLPPPAAQPSRRRRWPGRSAKLQQAHAAKGSGGWRRRWRLARFPKKRLEAASTSGAAEGAAGGRCLPPPAAQPSRRRRWPGRSAKLQQAHAAEGSGAWVRRWRLARFPTKRLEAASTSGAAEGAAGGRCFPPPAAQPSRRPRWQGRSAKLQQAHAAEGSGAWVRRWRLARFPTKRLEAASTSGAAEGAAGGRCLPPPAAQPSRRRRWQGRSAQLQQAPAAEGSGAWVRR
jgi:hypothetical protein